MNLPFEVPLPNGPVSHAGARFTVGWTATARVDINWAIDPKDSVEFTLLPSASAEEPYHYGFVAPQLGADSQQPAQAAFGAPAMILGGFGAIGLILAGTGAVQREWGLMLFGALFLAIAAAGLIRGFRLPRRVAERRLGKVQITVDPLQPYRGDWVRIQLQANPGPGVQTGRAKVTLRGQERTVRGTGKNRRTACHPLHESTVLLPTVGSARVPGSAQSWAGQIRIPHDAGPSFWETNNHLIWTLDVRIELPGTIDWTDTVTLGVLPGWVQPSL